MGKRIFIQYFTTIPVMRFLNKLGKSARAEFEYSTCRECWGSIG
jgi:hypothetical protein